MLDGWLVTPQIDIPDDGSYVLKFWSYTVWPEDNEYSGVWVSTETNDSKAADFVELKQLTGSQVSSSWKEITVPLGLGYSGQSIYIGFKYEGFFADEWFIDDITVGLDVIIPVSDITGIPSTVEAGMQLTLAGMVAPVTASNQNITWSVADAGTTGAVINNRVFFAAATGTAVIRATVENGLGEGVDYVKEFMITVVESGGVIYYPVWCNGERFSSYNLSVACGEGTAVYDPATSTLTLDGATIDTGCEIPADIAVTYCTSGIFTLMDLNVVLTGDNIIKDTGGTGIDTYAADPSSYQRFVSDIHVSGGGTLTITETAEWDGYGVYTYGALTIEGVTLYINSSCTGLWTNGLTVVDSLIVINNSNMEMFFGIVSGAGDVVIDGSILIGNKQPILPEFDEEGFMEELSFIFFHNEGYNYILKNGGMIITYDSDAAPYCAGTVESMISDPVDIAVWTGPDSASLPGYIAIPGVFVTGDTVVSPGGVIVSRIEPMEKVQARDILLTGSGSGGAIYVTDTGCIIIFNGSWPGMGWQVASIGLFPEGTALTESGINQAYIGFLSSEAVFHEDGTSLFIPGVDLTSNWDGPLVPGDYRVVVYALAPGDGWDEYIFYSADVFTITDEPSVIYNFRVGEDLYVTLEEATAAVPDGGTVYMLRDVTVDDFIYLDENKTYTIDFGGYTLSRTFIDRGTVLVIGAGNVTLQNGNVVADGENGIAIVVEGYAATFDNITADASAGNAMVHGNAVWVRNNASLSILSGTYIGSDDAVWVQTGNAVITTGVFESTFDYNNDGCLVGNIVLAPNSVADVPNWLGSAKKVVVTVHAHDYAQFVTDPTCLEQGYTTYTCSCGDSYDGDYTPALGHDFVLKDHKDATEDEEGYDYYECSRCDETKTTIIPVTHLTSYLMLAAGQSSSVSVRRGFTTAIALDTNCDSITYTSVVPMFATVDENGVITGKAAGITVIRITDTATGLTVNVAVNVIT